MLNREITLENKTGNCVQLFEGVNGEVIKQSINLHFEENVLGLSKGDSITVEWADGTLIGETYVRLNSKSPITKLPEHEVTFSYEYRKPKGKKWFKTDQTEFDKLMGW
jgi:hypothetical protein